MGFLSSILGTNNSYDPTDQDQVNRTKALAPQSGFKAAGAALTPNQNYTGAINDTLGNAQKNYDAQTANIGDLRAMASGQGPSVAQGMLHQATNENIKGVASAVGSNRSLSPAQAARIAIEGGATANNNAAGQAATMRAQEMLGAKSLLSSALSSQGGQNLGVLGQVAGAQQGQQSLALQNALGTQQINAGTAASNAGLQLGQQQLAAGVGAGNAANNAGMVGGLLNGAGAAVSDERAKTDIHRLDSEALPGVKEATFRYKGSQTPHRGVIAQDVEKKYPDMVGRAGGYKTVPARLMKYAEGGEVPLDPIHAYLDDVHGFSGGGKAPFSFDDELSMPSSRVQVPGERSEPMFASDAASLASTPSFETGMRGMEEPMTPSFESGLEGAETPMGPPAGEGWGGPSRKQVGEGLKGLGSSMMGGKGTDAMRDIMGMRLAGTGSIYAEGGRVDALVSPDEVVVPPDKADSPAAAAAMVAKGKGKVPGKAKVKGDSPKNDTVRAKLAVGSVVIPRSITQGENAPERAADFVRSLQKRHSGNKYARGGKVDLSEGGWV